jgi:hypothetical protein
VALTDAVSALTEATITDYLGTGVVRPELAENERHRDNHGRAAGSANLHRCWPTGPDSITKSSNECRRMGC